ncbi:hypothetical protein vseg_018696 [Gypsophila vaccaria]
MAAIIYSTYFYSPKLSSSSSFRTTTFNNQSYNHTKWSNYNLQQCTGLIICKSSSSSSKSYGGGGGGAGEYDATEESRWLREEQRWLREEQRWFREEARWNAERTSLLLQIQRLQSQLDRLRRVRSDDSVNLDANFVVDDDADDENTLVKVAALLNGLRNDNSISEKKSKRIADFVVAAATDDVDDDSAGKTAVKMADLLKGSTNDGDSSGVTGDDSKRIVDVFVDAPVSETESKSKDKDKDKGEKKRKTKTSLRSSLRMGAEGDEVRVLQEALMSLGFYSGEEDMEYSSFSEGTSRAVKTWQASIGIREDGVMTAELLERLYASPEFQSSESSLTAAIRKIDEANGAVLEVREVQETVAEKGITDVPHNRVFLLGENRWEEPSRLNKSKGNTQVSGTRCLTCKGAGRLLCMECDGTGEPNLEEQFLDWVEEGAKCPYCEGVGFNVCDVCDGKSVL